MPVRPSVANLKLIKGGAEPTGSFPVALAALTLLIVIGVILYAKRDRTDAGN